MVAQKKATKASKGKKKLKRSTKTKSKAKAAAQSKSKAKAGSAKAASGAKVKANAKPGKSAKAKSAKIKPVKAKSAGKLKKQKPIELYFWPTPNGLKISIALEELRLPYEIYPINISKGEQFAPEFLKISPNNRIPAIIDPDGPGGKPISIFESGAILQYLGEKTGKLYPKDWRKRVAVDEWLFWQVGGLGPMAGQAHHFIYAAPERIPYATERYIKESTRLYGVMEKVLADRPFLAGAYSIADIAAYGWATAHERHLVPFDGLKNVQRWFDAVGSRPAVKRGQAIGAELRPPMPPPPSLASVLAKAP